MQRVAPFVGAWIEIHNTRLRRNTIHVAPFVGAWIEMPSVSVDNEQNLVAPFVGAWIEIFYDTLKEATLLGRSVRRSVD